MIYLLFGMCDDDLTRGRPSLYDPECYQPSSSDLSSDSTNLGAYSQPVRHPTHLHSGVSDDRYSHAVFHCSSSNGRGPRCAAWYEDALNDKGIKSNSYVLTGGIKGWMEQYPDEVIRI